MLNRPYALALRSNRHKVEGLYTDSLQKTSYKSNTSSHNEQNSIQIRKIIIVWNITFDDLIYTYSLFCIYPNKYMHFTQFHVIAVDNVPLDENTESKYF